MVHENEEEMELDGRYQFLPMEMLIYRTEHI